MNLITLFNWNRQYEGIRVTDKLVRATSKWQEITLGGSSGIYIGTSPVYMLFKNMATVQENIPTTYFCLYADDSTLNWSTKTIDKLEMLVYSEMSIILVSLKSHNFLMNENKTQYEYCIFNLRTPKIENCEPLININAK